jgi:hypothetical protein
VVGRVLPRLDIEGGVADDEPMGKPKMDFLS